MASLDAEVIGVSRDSVGSHDRFKAKHGLNFTLASDEDGTVCEAYGTWAEKLMYGKKYLGIDRSTFSDRRRRRDPARLAQVKVPGHIEEVLAAAGSI